MVKLANVPLGHDLPPLRLIGFIVELCQLFMLTVLTILVGYKLWHRKNYHINLRITVFNMYLSNPILTVSRSIWIIHILMEERLLSPWMVEQSIRAQQFAITAFWINQLPAIIERICATIFYRTYMNWKCHETFFVVFISWTLGITISYDVIPMPIEAGYAIIFLASCTVLPVYVILFRVNFKRFKNKSQNLTERYQIFQNVESLYPLAWTVAVEVVHNIETVFGAVIFAFIVEPSDNNDYQKEEGRGS